MKSISERFFHALGFEIIAFAITAPGAALILKRSVLEMGSLAISLATIAMLWNIIYNALFDRLWPRYKTLTVRVIHAIGFEGGFILIGLPVAAWMMDMTLLQAFFVEIGFFAFFIPYTMGYNWMYDVLRMRWRERCQVNK